MQARGVEREQPAAGVVEDPHRRPHRQCGPLRTACTPGRTARPAMRTTAQISTASTTIPISTETGSHQSRPNRSAYDVGSSASSTGRAAGQHRHDRQAGEQHGHRAVRRRPGAALRRPVRPRTPGPPLDPLGRGARPVLALRHRPEHRRPGRHLGVLADVGAGAEHAAGADPGPGADPDRPQVHHVAVHPEAAEVDLGLDRAAAAQVQHPGDRRDAVQVDVTRDLDAEQPREPGHVRRPGQPGGAELFDHALGHPQPQVHLAAARVVTRLDTAEQGPGAGRGQQHPARRRDEDQPAEGQQPPRCLG